MHHNQMIEYHVLIVVGSSMKLLVKGILNFVQKNINTININLHKRKKDEENIDQNKSFVKIILQSNLKSNLKSNLFTLKIKIV
jgi:hypothetical protein